MLVAWIALQCVALICMNAIKVHYRNKVHSRIVFSVFKFCDTTPLVRFCQKIPPIRQSAVKTQGKRKSNSPNNIAHYLQYLLSNTSRLVESVFPTISLNLFFFNPRLHSHMQRCQCYLRLVAVAHRVYTADEDVRMSVEPVGIEL